MSLGYARALLEAVSSRSTVFSKIWLIVSQLLRIGLILTSGRAIYEDERDQFYCNSREIGCNNECFNAMIRPLGHMRFWYLQLVMLIVPNLLYTLYVDHSEDRMRRGANRDVEHIEPEQEGPKAPKSYMFQILVRATLEALFLFGQYWIYGMEVQPHHVCSAISCKGRVSCYPSRADEKTGFLRLIFAVNSICLLFAILEIGYLVFGYLRKVGNRPRPPIPEMVPLAELRE